MQKKILNHREMFSSSIFVVFLLVTQGCESLDEYEFAEDTYEEKLGKIIHASVMFRHGNRNPYAPYPFDPYKDFEWPEGIGHLTNTGKQCLYNLGKWFRKRYEALISDRYHYQDIKVDSSDFDRTIMSAQCFLAGLYPPSESEMWEESGLQWQPIPVHTIPLENDNLIALWRTCETYNNELYSANTASEFVEMFKTNQNFFNFVGMSTGIMFNENFIVLGLLKLMEVYDTLNVQTQNGFELPFWTHTVYPQPMKSLAMKLFDLGTYTDKMKRLKAGPFLKSIIADMQKKVEDNFEQSMHFYSGHDSTISTIMITLEIFNNQLPPYGAAIMFELREKDNEHYVTVFYRNDSEVPPYHLEIPACRSPCTLEDFIYLTKPFIPDNWDEECKVQPVVPEVPTIPSTPMVTFGLDDSLLTTNQVIILSLVVLFMLSTILYFSIKRRGLVTPRNFKRD